MRTYISLKKGVGSQNKENTYIERLKLTFGRFVFSNFENVKALFAKFFLNIRYMAILCENYKRRNLLFLSS